MLRQGKPLVVSAKECEIFDAERGEYRGFLNLVMSNQGREPQTRDSLVTIGKPPVVEENPFKRAAQPSQKEVKTRRRIVSRPMDVNDIK